MKPWVDVPDLATGDVISAETWDVVRNDLGLLLVGPKCVVTHNVNQSISSGVSTVISFNTEIIDTDEMHNPTTNNSRITINTAGKYLIGANLRFGAANAGTRNVTLSGDGGTFAEAAVVEYENVNGDAYETNIAVIVSSNVGVYWEIKAVSTPGLNIEANTFAPCFWACWIGKK